MVKEIQIQSRDEAILKHVMRYRITTTDALKRLFFDDLGLDALKSNRRRLLKADLLASEKLYGKTHYYRLTKSSVKRLGGTETLAEPLGEQALPTHFGILSFCCLAQRRRTKFTSEEFEKHFPKCVLSNGAKTKAAGNSFYYLDGSDEKARLGQILVDLGGSPSHVLRKCNSLAKQKGENKAFRDLLYSDEFLIAVVTAEESKAQAIRRHAKQQQFPIRLHVESVPGLRNVLHVSAQ